MKKALLWLAAMAFVAALPAQTTVEFSDNFDSGLTNWVLTGNWGASTAQSYSPSFSLSESPVGDYLDNELTYATMANGVNLSTKPSAELKFYMRYEIEAGFDYMYLDVSNNNFSTFNTLDVFDGSVSTWTQYTYDLGGYCGGANTNVKIRFRFDSDGGWVEDGAYIDNFQIISSNVDVSPPLIVHAYPQFYKGSPGAHNVTAELIDISGIATSTLHYWVDDVAQTPISGVHSAGTDTFLFVIPVQDAGSWVKYVITASDSATTPNTAVSDTGRYIAGNYIYYDNGVVSFYVPVGPAEAARSVAVKITLGNADLRTLLLRNYTDQNNPNNPMQVHVWSNNGGLPGTDVIPPITLSPEASLTNTSPMTRIDLRPYDSLLSNLSGDYFIGYSVPSGVCNTVETSPGFAGRSVTYNGTSWTVGSIDYHFRAITTPDIDVVGPIISNNSIPVHYEGGLGPQTVVTTITDGTGVDPTSVKLHYQADGAATATLNGFLSGPDEYSFTFPAFSAGTWVSYWIEAADVVTPTPYVTMTDTFRFISGNYIKYDNGQANYYFSVGPGSTSALLAAAVQVTLNGTADLTTILIRNFDGTGVATPTPPNSPMNIQVWSSVAGLPGTNILTSTVTANAEATQANNAVYTRIDMRPYASQLSGLSGDFFIGFSVNSGIVNLMLTEPGAYNRSFNFDGLSWFPAASTTAAWDYHFRCITTEVVTGERELQADAEMAVFPNPTSGMTWIGLEGLEAGSGLLRVIDLTGRVVYQQDVRLTGLAQQESLDLQSLPSGIYSVTLETADQRITRKLILN